jgi:uncharacterized protein
MSSEQEESDESRVFRPNGISFLIIPSVDYAKSAKFYEAVFGWKVEVKPGHASFEDGTGHVIGHWESEFSVAGQSGIMPFVYVERLKPVIERINANGGQIVKPPYPEGNLTVTLFRDPMGNVLGIWQQGSLS